MNDDIREEIRKLSSASGNIPGIGIRNGLGLAHAGKHNTILSFGDWSDSLNGESPIEDIHPTIASDIDRRTNYWTGAIAHSVQEARANIYKVSGIQRL